MSAGNSVTLVGNVTRHPELRFTPSGKAVVTLGMAVNNRYQDRTTQEWKEDTSFFNVVVWDTQGENVAESCPKGTRITVVGQLKQRSWETPEGEKRSVVEVKADEVGVALRWATAMVMKNERRSADAAPEDLEGAYFGEPTPEPAMAGAGAPAADEEPF